MALRAPLVFLVIACFHAICQVSESHNNHNDCCLKVGRKEIPHKNVRCYRIQNEMIGCPIKAVVFTTRRNVHLCAPPDEQWVKNLMNKIDERKYQIKC